MTLIDKAEALSPCPFCGGSDIEPDGVLGKDAFGMETRSPQCMGCGATAESAEAWNCRAALAPTDAAHVNETPKSEHDAGNVLTDAALIARLREIQGQAGLFASAAAERIEALRKERDEHAEALKVNNAVLCDALLRNVAAEAEVEKLTGAGIEAYYARQVEWSRETFGPALRTKGIIDHITKELREIAADPHDLSEWIDVVILAMDGFWRHGGKPEDLMPALLAKQAKNMARTWPDWRGMSEDAAIEHDRSKDAALSTTEASHE